MRTGAIQPLTYGRTPHPMNVLWFEFVLSLRRLLRRPWQNGLMLVTFAVSLSLALLSWSLFRTIFLSQPDYDPRGDYWVLTTTGAIAVGGDHYSHDEIQAIQSGQSVFADFAPVSLYSSAGVDTGEGSERYLAAYLSSRALRLTGAQPILGRLFTPAEDDYRGPAAALISERLWTETFHRDPNVVGKPLDKSRNAVTIVGVLPAGYRFPNDQDLWFSLGQSPDPDRYQVHQALVKLKPGITRERAEQDMKVIFSRLPADSPFNKYHRIPALRPFRDLFLMPEIRVSALILFALAMIFVLVSCANAANLMLIDFLGRRAEVASALALGIPRRAAIRAVCAQVGVIALLAAVIALGVLPIAGPLLYDRIKIINAPYWLSYRFSWDYVGTVAALAALSGAVTLVAPVLYLLWMDSDAVIRENAHAIRGAGRAWWRRTLLTGQIALLTVLAVCSGLLVRSSYHVSERNWGYPAARVFMGKLNTWNFEFPDRERAARRQELYRTTLRHIDDLPATAASAIVDNPPGYSNGPYCQYALDPGAFAAHVPLGEAFPARATERYFEAMDVPFVAGQTFAHEAPPVDAPQPAVINASLAQKLWPNQDPLQRVFYTHHTWMKETDPPMKLVVAAVVRDFQACGPTAKTNDSIIVPLQTNTPFVPGAAFLLVRNQGGTPDPREVNRAVHRADPRLIMSFPSTVAGQIELMLSSVRMTTDLTTLFAAAAVLLCAIGVYSLTVAQVLQSSRDFGIRLALGGEPGKLWAHFARGLLVHAAIGVALGAIATLGLVRVLASLLHGVSRYHVPTYLLAAVVILVVAFFACVPSLFRLKKINPADCLRSL